MEIEMKKVKIITITLAIILITLVSFVGVYMQTQNKMENKVKDYELSRELKGARIIELSVKKEITDKDSEEKSEENSEEKSEEKSDEQNAEKENKTENLTLENYEIVKKTIEKRLKALKAEDYTISLNEETGNIIIELSENNNTDSYAYYVTASGKVQVKEKDSGNKLVSDSMIKKSQYTYRTTSDGKYQVNLVLELNKEGQAKIEEISKDYAILSTEIDEIEAAQKSNEENAKNSEEKSEENVENPENTEQNTNENQEEKETKEETKKIAVLTVADSEYDIEKIEKNKLTLKIGGETANTTSLNNNMAKAAELAMLINAGKMPIDYEIKTNRYIYSEITNNQMMYFALAVLAIIIVILVIVSIKYRINGLLVSISTIGFISLFTLLLRYTNVLISIEGIGAIILIITINIYMNIVILSKIQKIKLINEATYSTYKEIFLRIIPIIILSLVFCFSGWTNLSSFGMVMFWGLALIAVYNIVVTKTLLNLKENK